MQEPQETRVWSLGWEDPGGGNGNPLQYSLLENPMDRETWQAIVHGVAKSWTQLNWLSTRAHRDLFKKIGDINEIHARMGTVKDRNNKDLTEAEEIKMRWQEYTKELYKKVLMTQKTMIVWSLT